MWLWPKFPLLLFIPRKGGGGRGVEVIKTLAALVALFTVLTTASCSRPSSEPLLIQSSSEYQDVLNEVERLTKGPLEKYDLEEKLEDAEKKDLRTAIQKVEGLVAFRPNNFANYFLLGKIYQALDEHEAALTNFRESIDLIAENASDQKMEVVYADAYALRSRSLERMGVYEEAESDIKKALTIYPDGPDYLAQLASVEIQLGKLTDARFHLARATSLFPDHARSLRLIKLIDAAEKDKPKKKS
jgi:tetratricopeptide (TPR) repeat protein